MSKQFARYTQKWAQQQWICQRLSSGVSFIPTAACWRCLKMSWTLKTKRPASAAPWSGLPETYGQPFAIQVPLPRPVEPPLRSATDLPTVARREEPFPDRHPASPAVLSFASNRVPHLSSLGRAPLPDDSSDMRRCHVGTGNTKANDKHHHRNAIGFRLLDMTLSAHGCLRYAHLRAMLRTIQPAEVSPRTRWPAAEGHTLESDVTRHIQFAAFVAL